MRSSRALNIEQIPAVILAAGEGSRIRNNGMNKPKPLIELLGLSLLERSILTFKSAGIRRFYVVVGFQKEQIINHIKSLVKKHEVFIEVIESHNWQLGNGASASAPSGRIRGPFFLAMCDHLFEPAILYKLIEADDESCICRIAVDRDMKDVYDLEEATLVSLAGDTVTNIGKRIKNGHGVDTGIFLCRPQFFDVLTNSVSKGQGNLSDAIRSIVPEGKVKIADVSGLFWLDIDTPEDYKYAENKLLELIKNSKKIDGPVSKYINRHLSIEITRKIASKNITPNQISCVGSLIGIAGALIFFASGAMVNSFTIFWILSAIAGLLVQASSIIDGVDGEIARLKFQNSPYGAYVDYMLDRYVDGLIVSGMSYALFRLTNSLDAFLLGGFALIGLPLSSIHRAKFLAETKRNYLPEEDGILRFLPYSRDVRLFSVFLGAIINRIDLTLYYLSIIPNVVAILRFYTVKRAMENGRNRIIGQNKRVIVGRTN